jgi:hypothetical protein
MDSSKTEGAKVSISILSSLIVGIFSLVAVSSQLLPPWILSLAIPTLAFLLSLAMSFIFEYSVCKKVNVKSTFVSSSIVALSTSLVSGVLFLENIPIYKYIFGEYAPYNPLTGEDYVPESTEYQKFMESEVHYKIQFFSNIVKAVLPVKLEDITKQGFAYFYWIFWMTLLPLYFTLTLKQTCSS